MSTTTPTLESPAATAAGPEPRPTSVQWPLGWLRGLAALTVVTFHAYQHDRDPATAAWPLTGVAHQLMVGSDVWVDMFFVLSGLVLWAPVARAVLDGAPARSGRMMLYRRMARLLPLYVVVVALVWALTNPVLPGHWPDLVEHLTFTHVYSDTYIFWTDGPAWSLAVEFHFYVLMALTMPVLFAYARRPAVAASRRRRIVALAAMPAACVVVTLAFLVWATLTTQSPTNWSLWYGPLSRAGDFGIGMLLAVAAAAGLRAPRPARAALAVAGVGGVLALVLTRPLDSLAGECWHLPYAVTIAAALAAVVLHDGPWPAWMSWRPLSWIGGLGYGIYLVHEPVMRYLDHLGLLPGARPGWWFLASAVIVAVPATALAWLSSRTLEAAGLRVLAAWERDGSRREYYPHLADRRPM